MQTNAFLNRIRSLSNIDGDLLPELTTEQQSRFLLDPVGYFLQADDAQADAIMREVENRQSEAIKKFAGAPAETSPVKAPRAKPRTPGQREMLLPISGAKSTAPEAKCEPVSAAPRKAG